MERSETVCSLCRRRKAGCDRRLPSCGLCLKLNTRCEYVDHRKRPGVRTGIVSQLESRVETLEATVRELEKRLPSDTLPTSTTSTPENVVEESSHAAIVLPPTPTSKETRPTNADMLRVENLILVCNEWFTAYHPWFPILHQPSYLNALQRQPFVLKDLANALTLKAIAAVVYQDHKFSNGSKDIQAWSSVLRRKIIKKAMSDLCLQSIQALLVLSAMDFGAGKFHEFWNIVALCKRMSMHLGLGDIVFQQGKNFNQPSTLPPRLLPLPSTYIDREERVRAYWTAEVLDSISTLGGAWNTSLSHLSPRGVMPCSDAVWAFPEHMINVWAFDDFQFSSAFSLCIIFVITELWHVHHFLQQSFDLTDRAQNLECRAQAQRIDEQVTAWRGKFQTASFRLSNAEHAQEERAESDPFFLLTICLVDCSVITLFQRMSHLPVGIDLSYDSWLYATTRCVAAADDMASRLAALATPEIDLNSPFLIFNIAIAARFYVVYSRAMEAEVPQNLRNLQDILRNCAKRWDLAARYEVIIRAAIAEHQTSIMMCSLPTQFYDLRYSTLDIHEALCTWVQNVFPDYVQTAALGQFLGHGVDYIFDS